MRGGRRGRGVMGSRGGTETNRARVKRQGAEKKRVKRMRGCEHDNDRVSERGSLNERPTERDESMWNTKGDRHRHLSHCTSVSLTLPLSVFFFLYFPPFLTCLFILLSTFFFFFLFKKHLSLLIFFFFLSCLPSLTLIFFP